MLFYPNPNRRDVLKSILGIAAWFTTARFAAAGDLPHLTSENPSAASLGYTENSAAVDQTKFPKHQVGQQCANCKYFQGDARVQYAPCALYPGNAVNADGWCSGYVAK